MITCIYDYILKKRCTKCMILMHEIACYHKVRQDCERKNRGKTSRSLRREGAIESEIGRTSRKLRGEENNSWRKLDKFRGIEYERQRRRDSTRVGN